MIGLFKGLHATISHLLTKKVTIQYPEERRELPPRSRGLIRLRLMPDSYEPRCISCTFCERICPSTAIKIVYDETQPGKVWTLDAGTAPLLCHLIEGDAAIGSRPWPAAGHPTDAPRRACLAASLMDSEQLTPLSLVKTARRDGVPVSQAYGIATFYDQLGPGVPERVIEAPTPTEGTTAGDCPAILLGNHGRIDPESIDDYSGNGGYQSVTRSLTEMMPAEVVEEIAISGLRGRGGAGRATSKKWEQALATEAADKYIICNAYEGDRDSFKDRSLLENNPHGVIEGMVLAGYATGARQGIVCLCADFALAAERLKLAIDQAVARGILENELPGTGFSFSIELVTTPQAFIGGEETALIATLESKRPMPGLRPPYPSRRGLRGAPTVVESPETLANIPWIIANGARAFQVIGPRNAPGTKLFTLSGAVANPGLYETTMDTSLLKLVTEAAGGFGGREAKAALVGGTGGGFLSPGLFDIPLDFDAMAEIGGDLSSGAIRVLDGGDCIINTVRQCLAFSAAESCGKCTPCRIGLRRLLEIIDRICMGTSQVSDLQLAVDLAQDIGDSAFCQLGRGAVKPLLTGINFFHNEFSEHVEDGKCSAGRCGLQ